jgi:hypothetical protein
MLITRRPLRMFIDVARMVVINKYPLIISIDTTFSRGSIVKYPTHEP